MLPAYSMSFLLSQPSCCCYTTLESVLLVIDVKGPLTVLRSFKDEDLETI